MIMKGVAVGLVISALLATAASADILAWDDAAGVRHYTNLKGDVPSQQVAEVVVDEHIWLPQSVSLPVAEAAPVAEPDPPGETEDAVLRAYLAGIESGLARDAGTGGSVYINGPLAVAISPPTPYDSFMLPGYGWPLPDYYPFVTTAVIGRHRRLMHARFGHGFRNRLPFSQRFIGPAGPPPFGAAGRPPFGAAGPPPFGAAGRPPFGVAHFRR